ncbi:MAG: hypothetical protein ACOYJI_06180 [Anaerovoracaceae bacterium]|jgi:hypothetical protein
MVSKTFSFRLSGSLIKEDLKHYWTMSLITLIAYFISGIFIILFQYNASESADPEIVNQAADFIDTLLSGKYLLFLLITTLMPIITSALVFGYLYNNGEMLIAHSQPFTRNILINSHTVAAIILCILPLAVTCLLLLILAHPVYYSESYYSNPAQMENLYSVSRVIRWFFSQVVCMLFVLSVSILSAMITGVRIHQAIASIGFNIVPPVLASIFIMYGEMFLFGFDSSKELSAALSTSPLTYQFLDHDSGTSMANIIYICAAILIYILAVFLYNKRKLERTGYGVVFDSMEWIIAFIFGILGMTVVGLTFREMFHTSFWITAAGFVIGALAAVIICIMIIRKQFRIFDRRTFRIIGSFMLFMCVFFGIMNTGGFGFENRIQAEPGSVTVSVSGMPSALSDNSGYIFYTADQSASSYTDVIQDNRTIVFNDKTGIEASKKFHQLILDNKDECGTYTSDSFYTLSKDDGTLLDEDYAEVKIEYHIGADAENSAVSETRVYSVPLYLIVNSSQFEDIFDTDSYQEHLKASIEELSEDDITHSTVYGPENIDLSDYENGFDISKDTDISGLISALNADAKEISYDQYISTINKNPVGILSFSQETGDMTTINRDALSASEETDSGLAAAIYDSSVSGLTGQEIDSGTEEIDIVLQPYCTHTLEWLRNNLGLDLMSQYGSSYAAALVQNVNGSSEDESIEDMTIDRLKIYADDNGMKIVTDTESLQHDFLYSASHTIFGKLSSLTAKDSGLYYISFFETNEDGSLYNSYNAYIRKSDLET